MSSCTNPSNTTSPTVEKDEIDQKVADLLAKMTLAEKVGQMNQYNGFWDVTGPVPKEELTQEKYDDLKKGMVGSMLNVTGAEQVRALQKLVVEETRLGIPLIFGLDVIHGHKTLAPIPLAEAASWDLEAIEQSARVAAIESSARGVNWTFAPMMDISRDARWGRVMEGGGEDPYLGSLIARARVRGFQGTDLSANNTIAACAKHFAGYGFAEGGRDYNTVDIGTSTLYNIVLPPFKAAIDEGVRTVMNSFNILNGIPATGDASLQRELLKGKWGFKGFVISDWSSGAEMMLHGFARDLEHVAELAVKGGSDMDMESYAYVEHLEGLVKSGKVDESLIDDAAARILRVKFELGLFDDPYKYCDEQREKELMYHEDHLAAALDMAKKSIVLLKNENNILPLEKTGQKIAVIGALAEDKNSPLGSWRIESDDNTAISVLQGLQEAAPNGNIRYSKGPEVFTGKISFTDVVTVNTTDRSGMSAAVNEAKSADVVVMVLGEHGFQSGEGRSRTRLDFPGLQQELLEKVFAVNKNVVLVMMNGRPLAIEWASENVPAIVEAWQLGTQTGHAVAQVLFGDYNPSGKLPMSFPRSVGQVPIHYNLYNTGRPTADKHPVFYSRYIDSEKTPLYPFGYGLSYTSFAYSDLQIDASDPSAIKVSATVKNTGNRAGEEITQLYIRDRVASVARPIKELKGFEKYALEPGASKTLDFVLTKDELGFFDNEGNFVVEPGWFDIMVGTSSDEGLAGEFELKQGAGQ